MEFIRLWLRKFLCFLGFHNGEIHTKRVIRTKNRKALPPDYYGIPQDAQVHRRIRLNYITDDWSDYFSCPSCKKEIRKELKIYSGTVDYDEMIFLRDGKCYIATPKLEHVQDE